MSNPISANNKKIVSNCNVTTLKKMPNPNDDQLHRRYSTTVRNKATFLRYAPYTTTHPILLTKDHFSSRQNQTTLSQRQMEINYQRFNHLNTPYGLQNTSNDYPERINGIFETMQPYFVEAGIIRQPQSYEESNILVHNSMSNNSKNTQLTHTEPDPGLSSANLIFQNQKKNGLSIFTENRATTHSEKRFNSTEPDTFSDSSRQIGAIADYFTGIEKNPESQPVENSGPRAEFTEQVKSVLPLSYTHHTPKVGHSRVERYPSFNQHQLSEPKSDVKDEHMNKKKYLWQFILHNLTGNRDTSISWVDITKGIFKINDLDKFSEQWTNHKKRRIPIIFDNIARSFRYYYKVGIMIKSDKYGTQLPRRQYRFNLSNPVIADYFQTIGLMR